MTDRIHCDNCGAESYADGATLYCAGCWRRLQATLAEAEARLMAYRDALRELTTMPFNEAVSLIEVMLHKWQDTNVLDALIESRVAAGVAVEKKRCAEIARDWDWRKSGDNTNEHIADAIEAGGK